MLHLVPVLYHTSKLRRVCKFIQKHGLNNFHFFVRFDRLRARKILGGLTRTSTQVSTRSQAGSQTGSQCGSPRMTAKDFFSSGQPNSSSGDNRNDGSRIARSLSEDLYEKIALISNGNGKEARNVQDSGSSGDEDAFIKPGKDEQATSVV